MKPPGTTAPAGYVRFVTLCGFLGWVFIYADRMTFAPLFVPISRSLGLSLTEAGFVLSVYMLGYVAMQIPFSLISDRAGLKRVLVPLYYISGLSTLLIGVLGAAGRIDYGSLLGLALVLGFSAAAFMPQMTALANYNFPPERRAFYTSLLQVGIPVGLIVALVSAGPVYQATGLWSLPLIVLGILTLAVGTMFLLGLRDIRTVHVAQQPVRFRLAFADRNLVLLYIVGFCVYYGNWVLISWGPSFFLLDRNLPLAYSGPLTALYAVLAIPAGIGFSRLSDRWGRRKPLVCVLMPIGALLLFLAAYVSGVVQIAIVLAIYGVAGALTLNPLLTAWTNDIVAAGEGAIPRATVMGVMNFSMMLSALLAPSVTPAIGAATGNLQWGFYLGVAAALAGSAVSLFIADSRPERAA
ncbi:MAG TPA: MFS transporter [Chloroflexota bacterium]